MKLKTLIAGGIVLPLLLITQPILADEVGFAVCSEEYINIRSAASTDSEVLGKIYNNGQVTIQGEVDGWYKVVSGNVEGYIKSEYITTDEAAADAAAYNVAYVYPEVLIVRAGPSEDSYEMDRVYAGQEVEVVGVEGDWAKVCLAPDSYGYISAYYIDYNTYYGTAESLEEEQARLDQEWLDYLAQQQAEQEAAEAAYLEYLDSLNAHYTYQESQNYDYGYDSSGSYYQEEYDDGSCYNQEDNYDYDNYDYEDDYYDGGDNSVDTSTPTATSSSGSGGQYLSDFAKQYVGNPYVWGGESLQTGADCSGFTKAVLNANGIQVNGRTAADQAAGGTKISLSEAQAGDLIYYDNGGGVYHIAIYNGDGTVTHSSNSTTGVTVSNINYSGNAAGAVRYW